MIALQRHYKWTLPRRRVGDWLLGPAARHPAPGHHAALDTGEGQAAHTQGQHRK